jgi:hypothetical protein
MEAALAQARNQFGQLHGLIHAAGRWQPKRFTQFRG